MSMRRFLRVIVPLCGLFLPQMAVAQNPCIANPALCNPCFSALGLPCLAPGTFGAAGLVTYLGTVILPGVRTVFYALAIVFFFYYGIRLLLESDEENTISEVKSAYGYGIAGAVIVSLAGSFADAFSNPATIIEKTPIESGLGLVIEFIFLIISISMTAAIVYLGIRLIMLQGQESEIEEQKKRFFHGLLGVAIIILARTVVRAFMPNTFYGGSGAVVLATEIVGIINFLLTLLGALAVLAIVVAGILLMIATDDTLKDRAKKSIFTAVVALIVVFSSLMIIRFVLML